MAMRRTHVVTLLAVMVGVFVILHPYLDEAGLCGLGGCPEPSQSSSHAAHSGGFSTACMAAVLVASGTAAFAFASLFGGRRIADHRRPIETYLSLDTPPPRFLLGR